MDPLDYRADYAAGLSVLETMKYVTFHYDTVEVENGLNMAKRMEQNVNNLKSFNYFAFYFR